MITEIKTDGPIGIRAYINVPSGDSLPLLIWEHGGGETGTNLKLVMKYGPLKQLEDGVNIGEPKVIIHPQNTSGHWEIEETDEVLEYCKKVYPVDPNRIYLAGCSRGGWGTWRYAQSPNHVKKLAAIVPICGEGNDPSRASVLVNDGIAIWVAHAFNDPTVPYAVSKRMVDAINTLAGFSQARFSEVGMWGHSAWTYFLKPEYGVYDWLKFQKISNKRSPNATDGKLQMIKDFINSL